MSLWVLVSFSVGLDILSPFSIPVLISNTPPFDLIPQLFYVTYSLLTLIFYLNILIVIVIIRACYFFFFSQKGFLAFFLEYYD